MASGPAAIRLQEVAADVGVSHPTVLHHFGSREALVEAVVHRALESIQTDVLTALQSSPAGEDGMSALFDRLAEVLADRGRGRALIWLALAGQRPQEDDLRLRAFAETVHTLRRERFTDCEVAPSFEDSQFTVVLAASTLLAGTFIVENMLYGVGLRDEAAAKRFRAWLARLFAQHFERGGVGQ